jgi:hypothetical protein
MSLNLCLRAIDGLACVIFFGVLIHDTVVLQGGHNSRAMTSEMSGVSKAHLS